MPHRSRSSRATLVACLLLPCVALACSDDPVAPAEPTPLDLLAMRMVSQVRQQLGVELPLGELFALGELAAVAAALNGVARSELTAILPV